MRAKDFFLSLRDAGNKIQILARKRRECEEQATRATGMSETNIRTINNRSRTEATALRLCEIEDQMADAVETYADLLEQAEAVLSRIENVRYYGVLSYRYVCRMGWQAVSREMGYRDAKSVFRVHGWALQEAQKIMDSMNFPDK